MRVFFNQLFLTFRYRFCHQRFEFGSLLGCLCHRPWPWWWLWTCLWLRLWYYGSNCPNWPLTFLAYQCPFIKLFLYLKIIEQTLIIKCLYWLLFISRLLCFFRKTHIGKIWPHLSMIFRLTSNGKFAIKWANFWLLRNEAKIWFFSKLLSLLMDFVTHRFFLCDFFDVLFDDLCHGAISIIKMQLWYLFSLL